MRYRLRSIINLHGYAVTKIKTTFAAQPPSLRAVSSEQVAHIGSSGQAGLLPPEEIQPEIAAPQPGESCPVRPPLSQSVGRPLQNY